MSAHDPIVFIVDDDSAVLDSLTLMLEQADFSVQSFESAEAFLNTCSQDSNGCAIIDVRMPGMDGMQLQEALLQRKIVLPVIFLTGHGDIPMTVKAIKAGAADFLTKPVTREKLLASVRSAFVESEKIIKEVTQNHTARSSVLKLTEREREIMALAIQGYLNKEIAARLGISYRTVEAHKSKIMRKTGAKTLLELARIAHEAGLNE